MKELFSRYLKNGILPSHELWEQHLISKLNKIGILGLANVLIGYFVFKLFEFELLTNEIIFALIVMIVVIIVTRFSYFILGIYLFYIGSFLFFVAINLKMGLESYAVLYYFPMMISMVQLLGRKETINHLYVLSTLGISSIFILIFVYGDTFTEAGSHFSQSTLKTLFSFNIISSFCSALVVSLLLISDYLKQERALIKALSEKEVLLAEVFHRVKNNMNIITSLLNLKKNTSQSEEVIEALEDCRSRVFSMALVHQNIYQNGNVNLPFDVYVQELINEITNAIGDKESTQVNSSIEAIYLNLSDAIPCGLILNELITNSIKHSGQKQLKIDLTIKETNNVVQLMFKDNGIGYPDNFMDYSTLGIELILSLVEQLNGSHSFSNENGAVFTLSFEHIQG